MERVAPCHFYDVVNRESMRTYSNGDPTVTTTYDQAACLGLTTCQNIGHRTSMTDAAGSESWSYDVVDRINKDQRTTNSITKSTTYNLDYSGNVTSLVYPTGRTVNYTYDAANRPKTAADGSNGITYANDFQTPPSGCLSGAVCYTPQGSFYALSIGQTSSFTGLNLTHTYNNRLQPLRFMATVQTLTNVAATATWASRFFRTFSTTINFTSPSPANVSPGQPITASGWTPSFISGNYVVNAVIDSTHFSVVLSDGIDHGSGTTASGNLTFVPAAVDISYDFNVNRGNSGHVDLIRNNLDPTRTQNFTYDQLNRIITAKSGSTYASSPAHCWGETYNVDPWGNLQSIAATTDTNYTGCTQESGFTTTADGNNHLTSFSYDLSGNTQNDGTFTYNWDAESQLKSAGGITYAYDGDGRRVAKVGSKLYWYGSADESLAETDASGNTTAEYIFFGGKRIAMLPATGTPLYYVEDLLGTSRVITTNTGVVCYDADFYPYGGERSYTNTCPQNNYKFEGKERDTETGNDDFGARYYSNRFGRWLSADWSAVPVPVPYANLTNSQTLNLYAMVHDDPESFADLDGHWDWGQRLWNSIRGNGWRTNDEVRTNADEFRSSVREGETLYVYSKDSEKLDSYTHDQVAHLSDSAAVQLSDRVGQSTPADEETLAKLAEITGQVIAVGTAVLPNASSDWGRNRLVKELHDRGFVMAGETKGDGGIIYTNLKTGEEIRIMPKPTRPPYRSEPAAKFQNEYYYRYRTGPDQEWGPHTTIPDK